jgi:hypothetical protein
MLRVSALPAALSAAAMALVYAAAGPDQGLFLGTVLFATLILPPLVARERSVTSAIVCTVAFVDIPGLVWLAESFTPHATLGQSFGAYMVLAAFACAMCGSVLFMRSYLGAVAAAAITMIISLAWLTWPIWLSPWLSTSLAAWLTPLHPLLAINHLFIEQGVWTQQRLMYRYTTLGQDISYVLPSSVVPCVVVHALIGLILLSPAVWREWSPRPAAAGA